MVPSYDQNVKKSQTGIQVRPRHGNFRLNSSHVTLELVPGGFQHAEPTRIGEQSFEISLLRAEHEKSHFVDIDNPMWENA